VRPAGGSGGSNSTDKLDVIKVVGSDGELQLYDLAVGPDGNVTAVGDYNYPVEFDTAQFLADTEGGWDAWAATVDGLGNTLSAGTLGGAGDDALHAVTVNPDNAVTAAGSGLTNLWRRGEPEWPVKTFANAVGEDVAVAPDGSILTVGWFHDATDFGGGTPIEPRIGAINGYVAAFDASGNWRWDYALGSEQSFARHVVSDPYGNMLIAGTFRGAIQLGPPEIVATGSEDVFVIEIDPEGTLLYASTFSSDGFVEPFGLARFPHDDGFVLVGSLDGTVDFGSGPLSGSTAAFVARFDEQGTALWSITLESSDQAVASCVVVNSRGDILLGGTFSGTLQTPAASSADFDSSDAFVLALNGKDGSLLWEHALGGTGYQYVGAIAVDTTLNIDTAYIGGRFDYELRTSTETFVPDSIRNIFIARLTP
jgi:hypothetical protein